MCPVGAGSSGKDTLALLPRVDFLGNVEENAGAKTPRLVMLACREMLPRTRAGPSGQGGPNPGLLGDFSGTGIPPRE